MSVFSVKDYVLIVKHYNSLAKLGDTVPNETTTDTTTTNEDDAKEEEITKEDLKFYFGKVSLLNKDVRGDTASLKANISSLKFSRKVYEPNEIIAHVTLSASKKSDRPGLSDLRAMFLRKPVELQIINRTIYFPPTRPESEELITTFTNFFVYEVVPVYSKDSSTDINLTLKIYSMDKLMTLDKYSQAYLGRKLKGEILKSVDRFKLGYSYSTKDADNVKDDIISVEFNDKFFADSSDTQKYKEEYRLQHLAYKQTLREKDKSGANFKDEDNNDIKLEVQNEFIQPYLVQYNESFYNFIKRISNRCGEFLYFENGKLNIGLKTNPGDDGTVVATDPNIANMPKLTGYSSLSFENISGGSLTIEDYHRDSLKEKKEGFASKGTLNHAKPSNSRKSIGNRLYKFSGTKSPLTFPPDINSHSDGAATEGGTKMQTYPYNSEIAHDEYFMPLYLDGFGGTKWEDINFGTPEKNWTHFAAALLNSTSLLQFVVDSVKDYGQQLYYFLRYKDEMNDRGKNRLITPYSPTYQPNTNTTSDVKMVVPFSEDEMKRWTTMEYYSDIKSYEERQQRLMATIDNDNTLSLLHLGEIFGLEEDKSTPYVACSIEINISKETKGLNKETIVNEKIKGIPMYSAGEGKWVAYPPVIDEDVIRRSGPQTAFVVDAADPKHQSRVRIIYPWQTSADIIESENVFIPDAIKDSWNSYNNTRVEAATPWIRMAHPSASEDAGIYFEPEPGDEVIVNYENDNIERPYVVGSLYSKDQLSPVNKGRRVIVSKFGHMIRFKDPSDGPGEITDYTGKQKFLDGMGHLGKLIGFMVGSDPIGEVTNANKLTGGIDLTDAFGMYKISMSSDERAINISSPFGDISLSAFTGINISAPNGDITISGKNIDIKASNKINIESGTNIERGGSLLHPSSIGNWLSLANPGSGWIDLTVLRTFLEVFLRPVDGTLSIKSHGFVKVEAGEGEAQIPKSSYADWHKNLFIQKDENDPERLPFRTIYQEYMTQIDNIVNTHFKGYTTFLKSFLGQISNFLDKWFNGIVENDIMDILNALYNPSQNTITRDFLNSRTEDLSEMIEEYKDLHLKLHDPLRGLLALSKPESLTQLIKDFTVAPLNDEYKERLEIDIKRGFNTYNSDMFDVVKDAVSLKGIYDSKRIDILKQNIPLEWKEKTKIFKRQLAINIIDVKNSYKGDHIEFKQNVDIKDDDAWKEAVLAMEIKKDLLSAGVSFITDNLKSSFTELVQGIDVWQGRPGSVGKILISDNPDHTLYFDNTSSAIQRKLNESGDKELSAERLVAIKDILYSFK
ncbi:MAG: hypothetical protein J1E82_04600 [Muribaculaceae bacterium]|nr:hypothetical protein [Muribaculaceae bacterium]